MPAVEITSSAIYQETTMRGSRAGALLGGIIAACFAAVAAQAQTATATLKPTAGNTVAGAGTVTQKGDKVLMEAEVSGLASGGPGFHVPAKGDCSPADRSSAGAHFKPPRQPPG